MSELVYCDRRKAMVKAIAFPTTHLRLILRDTKRILQQTWRIEEATALANGIVNYEWRDVPLEVEE